LTEAEAEDAESSPVAGFDVFYNWAVKTTFQVRQHREKLLCHITDLI